MYHELSTVTESERRLKKDLAEYSVERASIQNRSNEAVFRCISVTSLLYCVSER